MYIPLLTAKAVTPRVWPSMVLSGSATVWYCVVGVGGGVPLAVVSVRFQVYIFLSLLPAIINSLSAMYATCKILLNIINIQIILSLNIEKCFEMYQKCLKYPPNITQCTLYIHVLLMNNLGHCSHTHQVQFILKQSIEYTSTNGDYKLCTLSHTYIYTYYMYM